jgi:hypothetical protein
MRSSHNGQRVETEIPHIEDLRANFVMEVRQLESPSNNSDFFAALHVQPIIWFGVATMENTTPIDISAGGSRWT